MTIDPRSSNSVKMWTMLYLLSYSIAGNSYLASDASVNGACIKTNEESRDLGG